MKKKVVIAAGVLALLMLIGILLPSASFFNPHKREAFEMAKEMCEESIKLGEELEKHIEALEKFEKEHDSEKLTRRFTSLKSIRSEVDAVRDEQENALFTLLHKYTDIEETTLKTAFDSYVSVGYYTREGYSALISYNSSEGDKLEYENMVKKAKRSLKIGKGIFEKYYNICK